MLLAALFGIREFTRFLGWFWLVPLVLLGVVWLALLVYADLLDRQGRYDQALRLAPLLFMSGVGRSRLQAFVLINAGRYEEAECILRKIIDGVIGLRLKTVARAKTSLDLESLGDVLMETGRYAEAQRSFRQAAGMNPNHSVWATGLAETLLRQGVFPERALAHAERALNLFHGGAERVVSGSQLGVILATKAWALAACGREMEAQEAIDASLRSPARKTRGPLAQVHFKAGMSLLALSDHQGAERHFARGAELDPVGRWGRHCAEVLQRQRAGDSGSPNDA